MLLIWDLDGTLVDSRADIVSAAQATLAELEQPPVSAAQVASYVGDGIGKLIERLLPAGSAVERAQCQEIFERHYAAGCCQATAAYPGIHAALRDLTDAGWQHAVATNKAQAYTAPILQHCGLAPYFAAVRSGDAQRKPDPWQLLDIVGELGAEVTTTWMIGDHHTDILAARAAGCRVLFCAWGMGHANGLPVDAMAMAPDEIAARLTRNPRR